MASCIHAKAKDACLCLVQALQIGTFNYETSLRLVYTHYKVQIAQLHSASTRSLAHYVMRYLHCFERLVLLVHNIISTLNDHPPSLTPPPPISA